MVNLNFKKFCIMLGYKFYSACIHSAMPISRNDIEIKSDVKSSVESVLDIIYSTDPMTGLPSGALGHYFSDNASPELRKFIEEELFGKELPETAVMFGTSDVREELRSLDDDFLIETLHKPSETSEEYADRMKSYINKIKSNADKQKIAKQIYDKYHKDNGSSKSSD